MLRLPPKLLPFIFGSLMTINWLLFWSVPIMGMGLLWKHIFSSILLPIYNTIDQNKSLRWFAQTFVYAKPEHADYFAISVLTLLNSVIFISIVFYWQMNYGYLPYWLIFVYYCSWVGIGGRIMGAAYTLAHKEGHNKGLYKKWVRQYVGNMFENWLGLFFGNVPWNFTTSHIAIHHKLNASCGDTFYMWDIDRSSLFDFMLFVHRIFLHMSGWSSIKFFYAHGLKDKAQPLERGMLIYWGFSLVLLAITRSFSFVFWIYFQPLICMSYFLALINVGFHGFIEYDDNGKGIPSVNSTAIIEGDDDYFGEDDHMAHHYSASVYYRDLPAYRETKIDEFKQVHASVFRKLSSVELSIFILLNLWDKLAEHYVDYTGKLSKDEIKDMLKTRAKRKELDFDTYHEYLMNPTYERRKLLCSMIDKKFGGKGVYTSSSDMTVDGNNSNKDD